MEYQELKNLVYETAVDLAQQGPGWAQESQVLRRVVSELKVTRPEQLALERAILTAWHELFQDGKLFPFRITLLDFRCG